MTQEAMPFFDSAEDATRYAVQASGKSPKAVAAALWPSLKADSAYARFMNALNPEKPEKLTADEHAFVAEFCQRFEFLYFMAHRLGHSRPVLQLPENQIAELQDALFAKGDELKSILAQIALIKPKLNRRPQART